MICYTEHDSPLGTLILAATEQGLCGVYFEEHKHFKGKEGWQHHPTHGCLPQAIQQLDEYFAGMRKIFDLPLDLHGTEFQRTVWQALSNIRFGEITTYTQHANRLGNAKAVRAVSTAIGRNPVSIIVPCHRVIGTSGALTGYAGGLERKQYLLALEARPR
ncbi:MAG: methylated-DNA--[protein]-cysteine S-methyltransferase [Burkholderiaceae bacterium]